MAACSPKWPQESETSQQSLELFPNYQDGLEIPCNIAPLNFSLPDSIKAAYVHIRSSETEKIFKTGNNVTFSLKFWKQLTAQARQGTQDTIEIKIAAHGASHTYIHYPTIRWIVLPHPIDPYLTYRLLLSGDGFNSANGAGYNRMELRERRLDNFDERVLLDNDNLERRCFSCHVAPPNNAQKMVIHLRKPSDGTLFFDGENVRKIVLPSAEKALSHLPDSLRMPLSLVYPSWHPNEKWIAFSTNIFGISGLTARRLYVDILDSACNIVLYNTQTNQITIHKSLWTTSFEETWPAWSPDGKWLYFCRTAVLHPDTVQHYLAWADRIKHIYFDLCRIGFDVEKGEFADTVQTILKGTPGASYAMPRVSPDGRGLLVCKSLFNSIPYHAYGDLVYVDLEHLDGTPGDTAPAKTAASAAVGTRPVVSANSDTMLANPADILNSPDCESWHDWSCNSRWVVFGSKRQNGHYQLPYLAYFDGSRFGLPFLLPQKNPRFYRTNTRVFNIPTFMPSPLPVNPKKGLRGKNGEPHEIGIAK